MSMMTKTHCKDLYKIYIVEGTSAAECSSGDGKRVCYLIQEASAVC